MSTDRADAVIAMRVLQAGTNDTGSHQVGDVIAVDAAHAELFELIHVAERVAVTDPEPLHRKQKRIAVAR